MIHKMDFFVCYGETDAGMVMYHGRYFNVLERARMLMLHDLDLLPSRLEKMGYLFVVARLETRYKRPIFLEDNVVINTEVKEISGSRLFVHQWIEKDSKVVTDALIEMALVDVKSGKSTNIPDEMIEKFLKYKN